MKMGNVCLNRRCDILQKTHTPNKHTFGKKVKHRLDVFTGSIQGSKEEIISILPHKSENVQIAYRHTIASTIKVVGKVISFAPMDATEYAQFVMSRFKKGEPMTRVVHYWSPDIQEWATVIDI